MPTTKQHVLFVIRFLDHNIVQQVTSLPECILRQQYLQLCTVTSDIPLCLSEGWWGGVVSCEVGSIAQESLMTGGGGGDEVIAEVRRDSPSGTVDRQRCLWWECVCRFVSTKAH